MSAQGNSPQSLASMLRARSCNRSYAGLLAAVVVACCAMGCEDSRAPAVSTTAQTPATQTPDAQSPTTSSPAEQAPATGSPVGDAKTVAPAAPVVENPPVVAPAVVDATPRNISFDKIKFDLTSNADYKAEMLTPEIKALDNHNVRIRGFMFPSFKPTGLTEWVLVRDNLQCCFGGNAILYDCIIVDMKPGKSTDYTTRAVAVEGTFTIRDWFDTDGIRRAIYHLDGESVRF